MTLADLLCLYEMANVWRAIFVKFNSIFPTIFMLSIMRLKCSLFMRFYHILTIYHIFIYIYMAWIYRKWLLLFPSVLMRTVFMEILSIPLNRMAKIIIAEEWEWKKKHNNNKSVSSLLYSLFFLSYCTTSPHPSSFSSLHIFMYLPKYELESICHCEMIEQYSGSAITKTQRAREKKQYFPCIKKKYAKRLQSTLGNVGGCRTKNGEKKIY